MSFPPPPLCGPDPYLTRIHLQELFDQYMAGSHPTAAEFTALVSNVRQPYLIQLMAAKDALLAQHMDHARQISDLHAAYQRKGAAVPVHSGPNDAVATVEVITSCPDTPAGDKAHELLDKSSALYVSRDVLANRDWVSWEDSGSSHPWKDHLELNAFKSKQPGTVRVGVVRNLRYNRIKCITGPANPAEALVHELEFWAYPRPVPGTRMITVANFDDSIGCMLVGEEDCEVDDWTLFFQIWLPV